MPQMIKVWSPDSVRECLQAALEIVDELDPASDLRVQAFQTAANMLANVVIQQDAAVPVPLPPFLNGKAVGH